MTLSNKIILSMTLFAVLPLALFPFITLSGFADDTSNDDFISVTDESISNNPTIAKILENIEKSKKEFSNTQQITEQQKFVDEQRTAAKRILEQELIQMFKDNEEFTPLSAFNKFLNKISDNNTKDIFQGLFDYQQNKVNSARDAMHKVLQNGGSLQDARNAYHNAAAISRTDMIQLVKELNIDVGFSDPDIQGYFDNNGKLPRYDDEQESILSFVDMTSSANNINSSSNSTNSQSTALTSDKSLESSNTVTQSSLSQSDFIQKLLEEIQTLKDKIKGLESSQNTRIQNISFDQTDEPVYFADWVSEYVPGSGPYTYPMNALKAIPVNALNEPNSYEDEYNSLALGRQGQVTLGFSTSVTEKLIVYEATKEKNINEKAIVEVSKDGETWTLLTQTQYKNRNNNIHEYSYDLSSLGCVSFVRITDNTDYGKNDGFDVDAVGATRLCDIS